ncbi:hypothetical protein [McMurdo Ice Shelf pond-associated circular DNA virus-2]|uniref:hypothetical protein n=1 Tax=McMurdo Ice Shelf pond-associated circular DNA virus-2 TaxID=1521386 RepID=UPI0004D1E852|nr:hypothetical protein [McMurdo Ice Shelf pond-associated circular DNA virus-2]AIF71505.1 hypothetical protein [McMurdo Ice Shelf pond-associated circular DNA virus-2]
MPQLVPRIIKDHHWLSFFPDCLACRNLNQRYCNLDFDRWQHLRALHHQPILERVNEVGDGPPPPYERLFPDRFNYPEVGRRPRLPVLGRGARRRRPRR